jgi:N-acetylneuraminic acid mutarotase
MHRGTILGSVVMIGTSLLVGCNENSSPTQPGTGSDGSNAVPDFAWASNSWQSRAPLPSARAKHSAGVVNNAAGEPIVYVFGGSNDAGNVTTIQAYNYASNTWATKRATLARTQMNGVGAIGSKLYVSGGLLEVGESFTYQKTLFAYDPKSDVLVRKADMPRPTANGVTGVIGGKLYVLTGTCGDCTPEISRRFYRYDPVANSWSFLTWAPHAHAGGAGGVINGKFYAVGGDGENGSETATLDVYDPASNRWTTRASMPKALHSVAGTVLNNKLYVIGGAEPGTLAASKTVYAYNPGTNSWATRTPMLTARSSLAAVTITAFGNSKIVAAGGQTDVGPTRANEAYKP